MYFRVTAFPLSKSNNNFCSHFELRLFTNPQSILGIHTLHLSRQAFGQLPCWQKYHLLPDLTWAFKNGASSAEDYLGSWALIHAICFAGNLYVRKADICLEGRISCKCTVLQKANKWVRGGKVLSYCLIIRKAIVLFKLWTSQKSS